MCKRLVLSALVGTIAAAPAFASSIAYSRARVAGTLAHVVTVNLGDPEVRVSVALAKGGRGSSEAFRSMMRRTRPTAAITGTFFDTRSLIPTGDIALFGTVVHSGCIGSALCIGADNKPAIVSLSDGHRCAWVGYETVLSAGPTLVADSKVAIALKHEGFRRSLHAATRRTAVGITRSGKLVLVAINRRASLYTLAKAMLQLNATDALCLDGGSSTALYYAGGYYATPTRSLTNCLVVYSRSDDYNRARTALAPPELLAKASQHTTPHVASTFTPVLSPPGTAFPPILELPR